MIVQAGNIGAASLPRKVRYFLPPLNKYLPLLTYDSSDRIVEACEGGLALASVTIRKAKRLVSLALTICMVATTAFTSLPVAMAVGVTAGTPYQAGGAYDVGVSHVVINQIYGGYNPSKDVIQAGTDNVASYKDKGQACSNSFIELYNPTSSDVDLSGWSVQVSTSAYYNSNQPVSTQSGKWAVLPLTGTIHSHSSYLIRGAATGSTLPYLTITNRDQDWALPTRLTTPRMRRPLLDTSTCSARAATTRRPTNASSRTKGRSRGRSPSRRLSGA